MFNPVNIGNLSMIYTARAFSIQTVAFKKNHTVFAVLISLWVWVDVEKKKEKKNHFFIATSCVSNRKVAWEMKKSKKENKNITLL